MKLRKLSLVFVLSSGALLGGEPEIPEQHYQVLLTGIAAAVADVFATHPLWVAKTALQQGVIHSPRDMARLVLQNPRFLYTGVAANAATMVPLTTSRVYVASLLAEHPFFDGEPGRASDLFASFTSGAISAAFSTPTEAIRTAQLVTKRKGEGPQGFYGVSQRLVQKEGWRSLTTGMTAIALRDGSYTAAFVSAAPMAKEALLEQGFSETTATILAYGSVSLTASLGNHPFDTIKTEQHTLLANKVFNHSPDEHSLTSACKNIRIKYGPNGFFKGYSPRGVRFMIGLFVKAATIEQLDELWKDYNHRASALEDESEE